MNEKTEAVINAMYFITNYPQDFIEQCWADDGMADWFRKKYNDMYDRYGSTAAPVVFFLYLDRGHQEKLAEWIDRNYNYKGK